MKKAGVLLLLLVILSFSAGCVGDKATTNTSRNTSSMAAQKPAYVDVNGTRIYLNALHFYMYGEKGCPHCGKMKELIPKVYGENSLTYYELLGNKTNVMLFTQIAQLTGISGVPAIAITYNGTLYAVIEGEFNVSATPEIVATAMKNDGMLLFTGRTYLLPRDDPKAKLVIEALHTLFVEHEPVDVGKILSELKANSTG